MDIFSQKMEKLRPIQQPKMSDEKQLSEIQGMKTKLFGIELFSMSTPWEVSTS